MAETSKREDVKSPQEIEDGIKSTSSSVTWNPFTVFPKEIYSKIFGMLESFTDKQNFMNAHMKFYNLFESKRTLFLFEEVLKEIGKKEEELKFKDYQECRLVCKDWDSATQKLFELHDSHFMIQQEKKIWVPFRLPFKYIRVPCEDFYWLDRDVLKKCLKIFSVTHPTSKNPFFSRMVTFDVYWDEMGQGRNYCKSVDALLKRYGQHIWHCKINISEMFLEETNRELLSCLAKWLRLMPELKTLEIFNEASLSKEELKRIQDMHVVQPELKNLVFLKSYELEAVIHNKLFGNLKGLEKIEIEFSKADEFLRNFVIIQRENLQEAFLTLKGFEDFKYLQDSKPFSNLKKLVIKLGFEHEVEKAKKAYLVWPEWRMIFKILEEKFPSLEELTFRLPKAISEKDKRGAIDHSLECQLNLKNLKKLWVNVSNICSLDFISPCKALVELRVILEHSKWGYQDSLDLKRVRRGENINFNMDLSNMWESNIWKAFPNLRKLNIWAWRHFSKSIDRYTYEKIGKEKKYVQRSYSGEGDVFSDFDD